MRYHFCDVLFEMLINQRAVLLFLYVYMLLRLLFFFCYFLGWENLLPEAGDGIEVALSVSHLTLALGQAVQFVHVAVGR